MASYREIFTEYLLVYCTSQGLASIGEPSTSNTLRHVAKPRTDNPQGSDPVGKEAMPVWIISVFLSLATANYFLTFMAWYIYNVVATVVIVASTRISVWAAAMAKGHEDSQRVRLENLARQLKVVGAFRAAGKGLVRVRTGSVLETRKELKRLDDTQQNGEPTGPQLKPKRRKTLIEPPPPSLRQAPLAGLWVRFVRLPCFRGFIGFLYMAVPQWYLSQVVDLLLSGQPSDFKLGYGTTSIVLKTVFGGGFAVWTHYCITRPSNKKIMQHFPKGQEVLTELWPITAFWAVAEHLPSSLSLSLSRYLGLKKYALDPMSWNSISAEEEYQVMSEFALVLLTYAIVTALFSVPATMILRKVYASMLSDEDLAIVPFHRGDKNRAHTYDQRSKIHKPGLKVSEAWATIDLKQYLRVLNIYLQYFVIHQLIQITYWFINWKLQEALNVDQYANAKLPYAPVGVILSFENRHTGSNTQAFFHPEL